MKYSDLKVCFGQTISQARSKMSTVSAFFIVTSFFVIRVVLPAIILLTAGALLQRHYQRQAGKPAHS